MRLTLHNFLVGVARWCGSMIYDVETGKPLGRALILAWRGRVHVIGLEGAVRPVFLPQSRLTYWKQDLGFAAPLEPDYPREGPPAGPLSTSHQG